MLTGAAAENEAVWRALADQRRRAIVDELAAGPRTTGELVQCFDTLCRTAVMKHLDVLEEAGLLEVRREGRTRWNHLNPGPIQTVCDRWISRHVQRRASALTRLKQAAEAAHREEEV